MSSPTNIFGSAIKSFIPNDIRLSRDTVSLICKILQDVNIILIDACDKKSKEITAKSLEVSIKGIIPKEMRPFAFGNGSRGLMEYTSGLLLYKEPKPPKLGVLEPRHLRSGLEVLAAAAHEDLTVSEDCHLMETIIQKLADFLADKSVTAIRNDTELSLQNMRRTLEGVLGTGLLYHAQGHAERNLAWFAQGQLDFSLKPLEGVEIEEDEQIEGLIPYLQKVARTQYSITLKKDIAAEIERNLKGITCMVIRKMEHYLDCSSTAQPIVTEHTVHRGICNLFPDSLCNYACAYGSSNIMKYNYGFLKYEDNRAAEETVHTSETHAEETVPDFRIGVRRMLKERNANPGTGFTAFMNDTLNDIASVLAVKCSEAASRRNGLLLEDDVITSVSEVLPEGMAQHAFLKLLKVQQERQLPPLQMIDALRKSTSDIETENETKLDNPIYAYSDIRNGNSHSDILRSEAEMEGNEYSSEHRETDENMEIDQEGSINLFENELDEWNERDQNGMIQTIENEAQGIQSENQTSNLIDSDQGTSGRQQEPMQRYFS